MKRLPSSILLSSLLVVALAACAGSTGGLGTVPGPVTTPVASVEPSSPDLTPAPTPAPTPASTIAPTAQPSGAPTSAPTPFASTGETQIIRIYLVSSQADATGPLPRYTGLVPVLRVIPKTAAVGAAAMNALFAGPTAAEDGTDHVGTTIPIATTLLGLSIKNGVAAVDLSTDFDSVGPKGEGGIGLPYRLAQVVYTLTQFSTVKSVLIKIDGQVVSVFGSAGIVLDGPVGRADYSDQLPAIFVDRPAYGAALSNPGDVRGTADVFEATFRVAILDESGASIVDRQVIASCGTGCRGTFAVSLPYSVARAQWGTFRVYDLSAKDGTPENTRDYPVWLTPAS